MKPLSYAVAFDVGQELVKVQLSQFYGIEINDFCLSLIYTRQNANLFFKNYKSIGIFLVAKQTKYLVFCK